MKTGRTSIIVLMLFDLKGMGLYIFNDAIKQSNIHLKKQQITGTCWSFTSTSFIESGISGTSKKELDLSKIIHVGLAYPEKVHNYVMWQRQDRLAHNVFNVTINPTKISQVTYSVLTVDKDILGLQALDMSLKPS